MTYALVGSGKVATTLAMWFARSGIPLRRAATRELASTSDFAGAPLTSVHFTTFEEAVEADVVIVAVPFWSHRAIARQRLTWHGQIVVDAMHAALHQSPLDVSQAEPPGRKSPPQCLRV